LSKTYLVLGGNGALGSRVVSRLSQENRVVVLDINGSVNQKLNENIAFHKVDFVLIENFESYLLDVDVVVHLICTTVPECGVDNIEHELEHNVNPTIRLLNSMKRSTANKIIFISSGGTIYGEWRGRPFKEDDIASPICKYGLLKLMIERYLELFRYYEGINYRVMRIGNIYSSKVKTLHYQGFVPILIDAVLKNSSVNVWGDGNSVRDFIHIDDVVEAFLAVDAYAGDENIFNVATGVGYSINQVITTVIDLLGVCYPKINYTPARICDVRKNILDIARIASCTGWRPLISIENGIERCIKEKMAYLG